MIQLDPIKSGALLLIGQLVDGIVTPFVGQLGRGSTIESFSTEKNSPNPVKVDKVSPCADKISRKKFWHLVGQLMTIFSFAFIFITPMGYNDSWSKNAVFAYYIPFIGMVCLISFLKNDVSYEI